MKSATRVEGLYGQYQKETSMIDTNWAAQQQAHQTHIVCGSFWHLGYSMVNIGTVFLGIWVKRREFIIPC